MSSISYLYTNNEWFKNKLEKISTYYSIKKVKSLALIWVLKKYKTYTLKTKDVIERN